MLNPEQSTTLERKIERFSDILAKRPGDGLTVLALAEASFRRGLKLEALTNYQVVTQEQPVPEAHLAVAEIYSQQGMATEAYGELRQLFHLDRENVEARLLATSLVKHSAPPEDILAILNEPTSDVAFSEAKLRLQIQRAIHNRELQERTRNGTLEPGVVIHEYYIEEAKKKLIEVQEQIKRLEELNEHNIRLREMPQPELLSPRSEIASEATFEGEEAHVVQSESSEQVDSQGTEESAEPEADEIGERESVPVDSILSTEELSYPEPDDLTSTLLTDDGNDSFSQEVSPQPEISNTGPTEDLAALSTGDSLELGSENQLDLGVSATLNSPMPEFVENPVSDAAVPDLVSEEEASQSFPAVESEDFDTSETSAEESSELELSERGVLEDEVSSAGDGEVADQSAATLPIEEPLPGLSEPAPVDFQPSMEAQAHHFEPPSLEEIPNESLQSKSPLANPEMEIVSSPPPPIHIEDFESDFSSAVEEPVPVETGDSFGLSFGVDSPVSPDLPDEDFAPPPSIEMSTVRDDDSEIMGTTRPPAIELVDEEETVPLPLIGQVSDSALSTEASDPVEDIGAIPVGHDASPEVLAAERQAFYESKAEELGKLTGTLARTRGVTSIFLVARDGATIDSVVQDDITEERVGELVRESFEFLLAYAKSPAYWVLECAGGIFVMQTLDDLHVLIAIGQAGANFGALRYTMDKTKTKFGEILSDVPR